ncbi:hypothetical protein [Thioclava sp.]|uniref:hypothetical protein n=1 Tax=Thioclava sp. TaxID=1933450 RepID=UPI003241EF2D
MTIQAATIQRDTTGRREANLRMSREELAGAWFAHIHRQSDDRVARSTVAVRARDLGMTQRDLARLAHRGGLMSDAELVGYLG